MSVSSHVNHVVRGNRPPGKGRGASNKNKTGNSTDRHRRKVWLIETYQADQVMLEVVYQNGQRLPPDLYAVTAEHLRAIPNVAEVIEHPTCRCYRCGKALWMGSITVDRIIPDWRGGTYARTNIRPSCNDCAIQTGLAERAKSLADKKKRASR